jgi:hypothetical protein
MGIGAGPTTLMGLVRSHVASMRAYAVELVDTGKLPHDHEVISRIRQCASDVERNAERIKEKSDAE